MDVESTVFSKIVLFSMLHFNNNKIRKGSSEEFHYNSRGSCFFKLVLGFLTFNGVEIVA
ncbi:hypothetical protein BN424_1366 [Carnobacterium maltaromaticum LMA28]|uniref:Uncharacterized protein n=1 Tax=Carnobacterium maltaromaticum LMA28 TaxID=1234679 RepID=K8EG41_CARML|nr:hypothetical protein BN424_1366 [Carnobacterium maltaromaticum LMA28]